MTTKTTAKTIFEHILELDLTACEVTVCVASSLKDETMPRFARLLLTDRLTDTFRSVAAYNQARYKREYAHGNLLLRRYAVESKPDSHEVEYLDVSAYETIMQQISPLAALADVEAFQAEQEFVAGMRFYVIAVQPPQDEPVYFFRFYSQRKMLSRSHLFAMIYGNGVFDRVTEPVFLFDHNIDCVSQGGIMYIFRKDHFQDIFRFFAQMHEIARETLETIRATVPIQNFEAFARDCEGQLSRLAKLQSIASKPYLGKISIEDIKRVIHRNRLAIRIVKTEQGEMLVYNPADKWTLLKLLNDDYLLSLMTEQSYEVSGKREVQEHGS